MLKMYSIYDSIKEEYNVPFVAKTDKEAQRLIKQSFQKSPVVVDVSEFKLWCVGDFDMESGRISGNCPYEVEIPSIYPEEKFENEDGDGLK